MDPKKDPETAKPLWGFTYDSIGPHLGGQWLRGSDGSRHVPLSKLMYLATYKPSFHFKRILSFDSP